MSDKKWSKKSQQLGVESPMRCHAQFVVVETTHQTAKVVVSVDMFSVLTEKYKAGVLCRNTFCNFAMRIHFETYPRLLCHKNQNFPTEVQTVFHFEIFSLFIIVLINPE